MLKTGTSLAIENIRLDGGTQPRAAIDETVVQEYAQSMMEGIAFPSVVVFYDGTDYWLADGFHRYHSAKRICRDEIDADIRQGTRRDAVLYSVGANATHGLRRTNADKRRAVETLLGDSEWIKWSDSEIARRTTTSHTFVAQLRSLTCNVASEDRTYVTKHGTVATMNTSSIGQRPQEYQQEERDEEDSSPYGQYLNGVSTTVEPIERSIVVTPDNLPPTFGYVNEKPFNMPLPDGRPVTMPDSWKLPPELRGIPEQETEMEDPLEELPPPVIDERSHFIQIMTSSATPEWYTPERIVAHVLDLFGEIDLDPCSNSHETPNVPARHVFTKDDDGLLQVWHGKVYMNPPYGGEIRNWTEKLVHEYEQKRVGEAIALVPGRIDTGWFQPMYNYLMCNLKGRLQFVGAESSAPFPSVVVYLGNRRQAFIDAFKSLGPIIERVG